MNTRKLCPLSAALFLTFSGCPVGPNYHPPGTAAPANWSEAQRGGENNSAIKVIEWWRTFHDPQLNSLVERAVQANYDLRIATGRLLESRATRSHAAWDFGPTITTNGSYTKTEGSRNLGTTQSSGATGASSPTVTTTAPTPTQSRRARSELYDAYFDATWEIDIFGGKRRAFESANANVGASVEDRRDVLVTVLGDVARNYVEVRGAQQRLAIVQRNIKAQAESVELARARFNAGLTSELDVKQAEALLATTQATMPSIDTTLKEAVHRLGVLLGQQPGALIAELSASKPIPPTPPGVPVGLPSELLRRRPDVRRAERQLAASVANIGVETAELFPKVSLLSTPGLQSASASDWFTAGSSHWSAGPSVTWRLLDFGRIRANINGANARQQQALATYEKTVLTSFEDVENALVAYANEKVRFKALNDSVAANRRAVELSKELYAKGPGDFLSVLDSERSLLSSEDQLVDSQRAVTENLVTLYKALGGGWETAHFALR